MKHTLIAHRLPWESRMDFGAVQRWCAPSRPRRLRARLSRSLTAALFGLLLLGPSAVRAAECPASSPEDPQERRRLAKEWFAAAEQAESAGNDVEATRAYACYYKMVAHPFTAFNLGRVAERSGENDLALKMFKAYVTLKPDASDKDDVQARIKALEDKIAAASEEPSTTEAPTEGTTEATTEQPIEAPVDSVTPPPETPPPPPEITRRPEPEPEPEGPPSRVLEWTIGGVAGVALLTGIVLNLAARGKMSNCENDATVRDADGNLIRLGTANEECNAARPLAYTSYAMFGVAAAAAVTDALVLILRNSGSSSSSYGDEASDYSDEPSFGFVVLPGGGGLTARGRF
jgi:hypothetical protein